MKRKYITFTIVLAIIVTFGACKNSFLDVKPAGSLSQEVMTSPQGIDALLTGCYHMLSGQTYLTANWGASTTNWVWGSVRGMEADKGSWSGDQPDINPIMQYNELATNDYILQQWRFLYDAINRCNQTITIDKNALAAGVITQAQSDNWANQAIALRGWYHFMAVRMWGKMIPYLDETTDAATLKNDVDITDKVIADLAVGAALPNNMGAVGRFNGTICKILQAKALMQLKGDYANALTLLLSAKNTGTKADGGAIGLAPTYGEIFDIANRNDNECIYTVQYSVNDGSGGANGGNGEVLNFPYGSGKPGTCCGFFQPLQTFVNSFRTDANGLPWLDDSYDTPGKMVKNDYGLLPSQPFTPDAGNLDPRLDWAVGRRGIPYWDWGIVTGSDWLRDATYSGPYNPKKQVYKKSQEGVFTEVGNWTSGWTANGYRMIRYADLLLLIAECQIETNNTLDAARVNINLVRNRASNPAGFVYMADGITPAANYVIGEYLPGGVYPFDTQANARLALRMERKLELGQEGHRYFDLQRWGNVVTELNRCLAYEKTMPWGAVEYGSSTVTAKSVNFPIPQRQIDLSQGNLTQNAEHQ